MPRVKWIAPPPNMLRALFKEAQRQEGCTSEELGRRLGTTADAVRSRYRRGTWSNEDIKAWCEALNVTDAELLGKAILS